MPSWPTARIEPARLRELPPLELAVDTNGDMTTRERARTVLARAYPHTNFAYSRHDFAVSATSVIRQWQQLADVVLVASLVIAGCSLAVSVVSGLNDRKRPFSLLRLAGVQLGVLRRVVALEAIVPLLAAAVVAVAVGFLAAHLFLRAQMGYALHPPGSQFAVLAACGLMLSLGIIVSTFPLLRRITGPQTARNE
jgi:predicted lysophospholipase L1 biosynthesis ABC-type transport system permease subunit